MWENKYKKFTKHVRNVVFYNESSNISTTSSNTEPHINDIYNTKDLFCYEIEMHLSVLEHKCCARLGPKKCGAINSNKPERKTLTC